MANTGSALLDDLLVERARIRAAWQAPRRALPPPRALLMRLPKLPTNGEKPLKERVAEAIRMRGQVTERQLHSILNAIYGSARDRGEYVNDEDVFAPPDDPAILKIQTVVAEHFNLTREEMLSFRARAQRITIPRQTAMYLSKLLVPQSLEYIGNMFGRDHSSISYASKMVEKRIADDPDFAAEIDGLRRMLG